MIEYSSKVEWEGELDSYFGNQGTKPSKSKELVDKMRAYFKKKPPKERPERGAIVNEHFEKVFGTTTEIAAPNAEELGRELIRYISVPNKQNKLGNVVWPLVRIARIYGPFEKIPAGKSPLLPISEHVQEL